MSEQGTKKQPDHHQEQQQPTMPDHPMQNDAIKSELEQPLWAVISFARKEAGDLTYLEAERTLAELETAGVTGLCIVTNDVALRVH